LAKRNTDEQRLYVGNKQRMYVRDEWKCRKCGRRDNLTPHHVVYQSQGGEDVLDNLLCLCVKCHDDIHAGRLVLEVLRKLETNLDVRFWKRASWEIYRKANENLHQVSRTEEREDGFSQG
jgi:5-methylcytosine-specific restriction endonuclease McrA